MKRRLEMKVDFLQPLLDIEAMEVLASIREFVNAQILGGFDSRKDPEKVEIAILDDSAVCEEDNDVPALYSTEFFRLGKEILNFVKEVLE